MITNANDLARFCELASQQPVIGVDTEFVWISTYYPNLGLVQVGWDSDNCALIDPIAINDRRASAPFARLLENPNVVKVFHEAGSDLPILHRWCGAVPRNVADTRIEAGFCGLTARLSLAKLLALRLGVVLPKTETRTNWIQRPLTDSQLKYACDDVALLPKLYLNLKEEVTACDNWDFFEEEMKVYEDSAYFEEMPLDDCWKRVSRPGFLKFAQQDYAVLQSLAAWREKIARARNIPRLHVLRDDLLATAAVKHPYSADEVSNLRGISLKAAQRYGAEVAEIVKSAMKRPKESWPEVFMPTIPALTLRQASERISSLTAKRAEKRKIDASLLASRRDYDYIAVHAISNRDVSKSPLMRGWRYSMLTPVIDDICAELKKHNRNYNSGK